MSIFENDALVREPRNERVSAKFRAAHRYMCEFSFEKSKLNETRYFSGAFKHSAFFDFEKYGMFSASLPLPLFKSAERTPFIGRYVSAGIEFYNVLNIADRLDIACCRERRNGCRKFFFVDGKPASAIAL